jgi:hypothetical protein
VLGICLLLGSVILLDLRLLGAWRSMPLAIIVQPAMALSIAGFSLAVATGVCMITTNASEYYDNPFLLLKFPAIGMGLVNAAAVSFLPAWRAIGIRELSQTESRQLAVAGAISLACWLSALAGGRMLGYW